jgi:hypothetical protein
VPIENFNFREFVEHPRMADWEVVNLYHHHPELSVKEIAQRSNRSVTEIYRTLGRAGGYPNRINPQHQSVRMYADAGMKVPHIADLTGYTHRNVRYILGRK